MWRLNQLQGDISPAFNLSVSRNHERFPWGETHLHCYSFCVCTWELLPNILTSRKILRIGSVPPFSIKTKIHPHMWLIHFSGIHPALSLMWNDFITGPSVLPTINRLFKTADLSTVYLWVFIKISLNKGYVFGEGRKKERTDIKKQPHASVQHYKSTEWASTIPSSDYLLIRTGK